MKNIANFSFDKLTEAKRLLDKGIVVPESIGFEHGGQWIQNPFYDETLRFPLEDPCGYYGKEKVMRFVEQILENETTSLEHLNEANQKYESCAFSCKKGLAGGCLLDGYPVLDCPNCNSYKHKEEL